MITLGLRDLSASVAFYEQGLILPRMDSPPEGAFFTVEGSWLGLHGRNALAAPFLCGPEDRGLRPRPRSMSR